MMFISKDNTEALEVERVLSRHIEFLIGKIDVIKKDIESTKWETNLDRQHSIMIVERIDNLCQS